MNLGLTFFACVFGQWCAIAPDNWQRHMLVIGASERRAKWKCLHEPCGS